MVCDILMENPFIYSIESEDGIKENEMKTVHYNKLVRDLIPGIVIANGGLPVTDIIPQAEMSGALDAKLKEETAEFSESHSVEELADILEVLHGIAFHMGIPWETIESERVRKREERGGFEKRVRLIEVRSE